MPPPADAGITPGRRRRNDQAFDLVVIGSGVAGLTAALTAALAGARPLILEHASRFGGTSARSSGTVWIPDSHALRAAGVTGDGPRAERYLRGLIGERGCEPVWRRFLAAGPRMLAELDAAAGIRFRPFMAAPDYRQDVDGAAAGGRALEPLPFDGRLLGGDFARLDWPIPELMLFGRMMITRAEAATLLRADRSPAAAALGARLLARYGRDRLHHPRGTRLVMGNALTARLWHAARDRGAELLTSVRVSALHRPSTFSSGHVDGMRIDGVEIESDEGTSIIRARRGVILAGGGFPANAQWRERYLPSPTPEASPAAPGCDGSTIELALAQGAALGPSGRDNALWFPSSLARRTDGSTAVYPHIVLDRGKPGLIAVDPRGRRFVDEAVSYHEFVRAMYAHDAVPAWLVCDRRFIARHGLGMIRPRTPSLRRHVTSGYLLAGRTIAELAVRMGIAADELGATVERFNRFALQGRDEDFGKGESIYDRAGGDPAHTPNPCLGPIMRAPFYAVRVVPTPLGTSLGLRADADARVLDDAGRPLPGLYVCGNDMHSAFAGEYPGAGAQLGQAMTFGWLAARHALGLGWPPEGSGGPERAAHPLFEHPGD